MGVGHLTFAQELATLASDCHTILESASVTYRQRTRGVFTAATMTRASTTTDTSITTIRGASTETFEGPSQSKVERVLYTALASQFSARPEGDDEIIDGTTTRRIIEVVTSVDQLFYHITTHRKV